MKSIHYIILLTVATLLITLVLLVLGVVWAGTVVMACDNCPVTEPPLKTEPPVKTTEPPDKTEPPATTEQPSVTEPPATTEQPPVSTQEPPERERYPEPTELPDTGVFDDYRVGVGTAFILIVIMFGVGFIRRRISQ